MNIGADGKIIVKILYFMLLLGAESMRELDKPGYLNLEILVKMFK
jgi:hypothetical protein